MKRKIGLIALMGALLVLLCACGKDGINPKKYVSSCADYTNMTVSVNYSNFTDDELRQFVAMDLDSYVDSYDLYEYQTIEGATTVSSGDLVNIDYVGRLNGEAFEGGTAQGYHLEIGSGSFIDGFEDGLIGVSVGDTVDLTLTFPEDYQSADLAGQETVFTVSVNSIDNRIYPDYNDDFFADLGFDGISTYEDYVSYCRDYIQDACDSQNESALNTAIWDAVMADSVISEDLPQEMVDKNYNAYINQYQKYADSYGTTLEDLASMYGTDMETLRADCMEAAKEQTKEDILYMFIADKEKIKVTDEMVTAEAEAQFADYGYESAQAMIDDYATTYGDDYFTSVVRRKEVMNKLKEYVKVQEGEPVSLLGDYIGY